MGTAQWDTEKQPEGRKRGMYMHRIHLGAAPSATLCRASLFSFCWGRCTALSHLLSSATLTHGLNLVSLEHGHPPSRGMAPQTPALAHLAEGEEMTEMRPPGSRSWLKVRTVNSVLGRGEKYITPFTHTQHDLYSYLVSVRVFLISLVRQSVQWGLYFSTYHNAGIQIYI